MEIIKLHPYHYVFGTEIIINHRICANNLVNNCDHIPDSMMKKFLLSIKNIQLEKITESISQIFNYLKKMRYKNIQLCMQALANQINFTLKEMYTSKHVPSKISYEDIYNTLNSCSSIQEAENCMIEYLSKYLNVFCQDNGEDKELIFIRSIQDFIASNYSDPNLSSQLIGEKFHLSAKYLMKRFQNYTGTSLNDYILDIRMEQAASLLKSSNLSVSKIASQVGILNENYFYKLFKKTYGCTPREYSVRHRVAD